VTARAGQLYDTEAETLPSVYDAESLLRIEKRYTGLWNYKVDVFVAPPRRTGFVSVRIEYGAALQWFWRDHSRWSCRPAGYHTVECGTSDIASAGPLRAIVHVFVIGTDTDAHLTATARAVAGSWSVSDTDGYADIRGDWRGHGLLGRVPEELQPWQRKRFARR
jgi:hypothetical protein